MIIKLKGVIYYPENALQSTRNTVFADKHMKEIQMWTLVQVNFVQCNINPIYYVIYRMLYIWNIFSADIDLALYAMKKWFQNHPYIHIHMLSKISSQNKKRQALGET